MKSTISLTRTTRTKKGATSATDLGAAVTSPSLDLEDSIGVVANANVAFGFLECIFLSVEELAQADSPMARRLAAAGAYWAGTLCGEMRRAQDKMEEAIEGGAA